MIRYSSIPANYKPTGVRKYDGNPFIEALPPLEETKDEILDRIEYFPPKFSDADRKKGDLVRIAELGRIGSLIYPFAEYRNAATSTTINLRDAYVSRNPFTVEGQRHRSQLATANSDAALRALAFKSSACGQLIMAVSGSGKTTFGGAVFAPYCHVIEHTQYKGRPFRCRQIPVIPMAVMQDASLLGFCVQLFETVDMILENTHYAREAKAVRTIPLMTLLMRRVAWAVALGLIFIDDLQHLRAARGKQAEMVLNMFSQILERAGVSLLLSATPALEPVIANSVRNIRKLTSGGMTKFPVMRRDDPQWVELARALWVYRIVKHPGPLRKEILDAWHTCSGGNPAFTAMSFSLAQRIEIGDREVIDDLSFERVAETDMVLLKPAIKALLSGNAADLQKFDDLIPKSGLMDLLDQLGWAHEPLESGEAEPEFDEFGEEQQTSAPKKKSNATSKGKKKPTASTKGPSGSKPKSTKGGVVLPFVKPTF